MSDNQGLILHAVLFLAWSVTVAVSAHRRVRNVVLSTAGAAGVATGTFVVLLVLTSAGLDSPESLIALFFVCLFASLIIAAITWIAMKLGGWLPKAEDGDDPGRGAPPA